MNNDIVADAHAVFLPAIADLKIDNTMAEFLRRGGKAILLGETRDEYVARKMSVSRQETENTNSFRRLSSEIRALAGEAIVALDQELAGICRLHKLTPQLPNADEVSTLATDEIERQCAQMAKIARSMGVNLFLSPILDSVQIEHPWLSGRHLGASPANVGRIGAAYVRGVQASGVGATLKHFPGFRKLAADPAIAEVTQNTSLEDVEKGLLAFKLGIAAGAYAVMTGPAPVAAFDGINSASTSPVVNQLLRNTLNFKGLVISDDIDAKATMKNMSLSQTAIKAINAGAELLLVSHSSDLLDLIQSVAAATENGEIPRQKLNDAASNVRKLAKQLS